MKSAWPVNLWKGLSESKIQLTSPTQTDVSEGKCRKRRVDSRTADVQDHVLKSKAPNLNMCLGASDPYASADYSRPSLTMDKRSAQVKSTPTSQADVPRTSMAFLRVITPRKSTTTSRAETPDKSTAEHTSEEDFPHCTKSIKKHPSNLRAIFSVSSSFGRRRQAALSTNTAGGSVDSETHPSDGQEEIGRIASLASTEPFESPTPVLTLPQQCTRIPFVGAVNSPSADQGGTSRTSTDTNEKCAQGLSTQSTRHITRIKPGTIERMEPSRVVPLSPRSLSKLYTDGAIQRKPVNLPERRSSRLVLDGQAQKVHSSCGSILGHNVIAATPLPSRVKRHSKFTNARKSVLSHSSSSASDSDEDMSVLSGGNETSIIVGEAEIAEICVSGRPTSVYRNRRQDASLHAARRRSRPAKVNATPQAPDSGIDCSSISSRFLPSPPDSSSSSTSRSNTSPVSASRSTSFSASSPGSVSGNDVLPVASAIENAGDRRSRHLMALTSEEVAFLTNHRARCSTASYSIGHTTGTAPVTEYTVPRLGRTTAVFPLTTKAHASSTRLRSVARTPSIASLYIGSLATKPFAYTTPVPGSPPCPYHLSPELSFSSLDLDFASGKTTWPLTALGVSGSASRRHPYLIEHQGARGLGLSFAS